MTGIRCPKCGVQEMRVRPWRISQGKEYAQCRVKICPRGHELLLFSSRTMELASELSACSF